MNWDYVGGLAVGWLTMWVFMWSFHRSKETKRMQEELAFWQRVTGSAELNRKEQP